MYKVLVVDDEKIILQGITTLVKWESLGLELAGTAFNGEQAYNIVLAQEIDIIITDIKMPIVNGIELIKKVKATHPHIRFIILSGHEEFEFAKSAMEYGVQHYLLKPCNHKKITECLVKLSEELDEEQVKSKQLKSKEDELEKVLPKFKEQLFRDMMINESYGIKDWEMYHELLESDQPNQRCILLLLELDQLMEHFYLSALKNIAAEIITEDVQVMFSTIIDGRLALLIGEVESEPLIIAVQKIQKIYQYYFNLTVTVVISESGGIQSLRHRYHTAAGAFIKRFYFENGSIITAELLAKIQEGQENYSFDHGHFIYAITHGLIEEAEQYIENFYQYLADQYMNINQVKQYTAELYREMIKQDKAMDVDQKLIEMLELQQLSQLEQEKRVMIERAVKITSTYTEQFMDTKSQIIRNVIAYMDEHIADEQLSLLKLAKEIMYMNADYLGRLFKKETGYRFTAYLLHIRIEQAKALMLEHEEMTINDIAKHVGFEHSPKYFSQVFKKETGYTPSDYRKRENDSHQVC